VDLTGDRECFSCSQNGEEKQGMTKGHSIALLGQSWNNHHCCSTASNDLLMTG